MVINYFALHVFIYKLSRSVLSSVAFHRLTKVKQEGKLCRIINDSVKTALLPVGSTPQRFPFRRASTFSVAITI